VNRRLAEHKSRKGFSAGDTDAPEETHGTANSRAAAAAARVAARYAKAPSYSEMQAAEARAALRAAEAATRAALEARAAAQAVLDHIEIKAAHAEAFETESTAPPHTQWEPWKATSGPPTTGPRCWADRAPEQPTEFVAHQPVEIRWDPDLPHPAALEETRAVSPRYSQLDSQNDPEEAPVYDAVEAAQPIPANLIQFPREIVAARRIRPRISEAFADPSGPQQLSIFEVDPNSISTEPMAGPANPSCEPTWIGSSWQQLELDDHPLSLPDYYAIPPDDAPKLYQAPFGRRMMATMVDTALIVGLVCGIAALVASEFDHLPGKRVSEVCGAVAVLGFAALYEWLFLTFAKVTPGMRYAQLSLCTFDEQIPTRDQVKARLKAMLISVLPVGLGMLWSIFDEDQMSWHDRLSKTYLRLS
jgi:uncharacterized RDD family membrane protein YckC